MATTIGKMIPENFSASLFVFLLWMTSLMKSSTSARGFGDLTPDDDNGKCLKYTNQRRTTIR